MNNNNLLTVKMWRQKYEQYLRRTASRETARRYSIVLENFISKFGEKINPGEYYRCDMEDYKALRTEDGLAHSTINFELAVIRAFWNFITEMADMPLVNPASKVRKLREPENKRRPLSQETVHKLLSIADEEARILILLGVTTGLRGNEIAQLEWSDFDFENKLLRLPAEKTKTQRARILPLRDDLYQVLLHRKGRFPRPLRFTLEALRVKFQRLMIKIGRPLPKGEGLHSMRRTFATSLLRSGVDLKTVSELLGHTDIKTTALYLSGQSAEAVRDFLHMLPSGPPISVPDQWYKPLQPELHALDPAVDTLSPSLATTSGATTSHLPVTDTEM